MLTKKKKLSRKEIKEDKLVTFYYKTRDLLEEFQKNIFIGIGIAAAIGLLVYFFIQHKKTNNEKASIELTRVMNVYDSGNYTESIEGIPSSKILGLKKIVELYSGSENGETARIYLANAYYFIGKFDDAMKSYEDYSGSNDLFKATAYAGQAGCYEAKKDYESAAKYYLKASSVTKANVLNPQYLIKSP